MEEKSKRCPKCDTIKHISEFGNNASRKDGLQNNCKTCRNSHAQTWYTDNPKTHKQRTESSRRKAGINPRSITPIDPAVLTFWHPTKNDHEPQKLSRSSKLIAWWRCINNHEWQRKIAIQKPLCSECSRVNKMLTISENHPELATQWHPTKNDSTTLVETHKHTSDKIVWLCEKDDHEWEARLFSRTAGAGCPACSATAASNRSPKNPFNDTVLIAEWSPSNSKQPHQISEKSDYVAEWICSTCNHAWVARVGDRVTKSYGCPQCAKKISRMEQELQTWASNTGLQLELNTRKVVSPQELDIYFPDKKIAVEFNGVYWHSEQFGKTKNYHYNKWLACKKQGIQLIQIWEDDWKQNKSKILTMLNYKLGLSAKEVLYARKSQIVEISQQTIKAFLEENHIQGYSNGSYYLGLNDGQGRLEAVMVLKKEANTSGQVLNIIRYATRKTVIGGFTKLLTYAERTYKPDSFITFSDHCVSDGGLYENNGFIADKELPPDYMYVVKGQRKHKFGYRLRKFHDDPNLLWDANLSEKELATLNNLPRIWDAGKTRWKKIIK
jgi:hypothetical protein